MKIQFRRKWESAHRFYESENRTSKCAQPHGHTWTVEASIAWEGQGISKNTNMLLPFEDLKKKWHQWIDEHVDHSFMVNEKDPLLTFLKEDNPQGRLLVTPGDPTTEILCVLFKAKLEAFITALEEDIYVDYVKIEETQTNAVVFDGRSEKYLAMYKESTQNWWQKNDFSTHSDA